MVAPEELELTLGFFLGGESSGGEALPSPLSREARLISPNSKSISILLNQLFLLLICLITQRNSWLRSAL